MPFGGRSSTACTRWPPTSEEVDEAALPPSSTATRRWRARSRGRCASSACSPHATRRRSSGCGSEIGDDDPVLVPHLDGDVHDVDGLVLVHRHLFAEGAERAALLDEAAVLSGGAPPLAVICWPFEHGTPDIGMGAGAPRWPRTPSCHDALADAGWAPTVQRISAADPGAGEVARIFELLRAQAAAVRGAVRRGAFPLVLAGGCISAAGDGRGLRRARRGLARRPRRPRHARGQPQRLHGRHGAVDPDRGAWPAAAATIPGFAPIAAEDASRCSTPATCADYQRDALAASRPCARTPAQLRRLPWRPVPARRPRRARHRPSATPTATPPPAARRWTTSWRRSTRPSTTAPSWPPR